jgi:hypothetical protein
MLDLTTGHSGETVFPDRFKGLVDAPARRQKVGNDEPLFHLSWLHQEPNEPSGLGRVLGMGIDEERFEKQSCADRRLVAWVLRHRRRLQDVEGVELRVQISDIRYRLRLELHRDLAARHELAFSVGIDLGDPGRHRFVLEDHIDDEIEASRACGLSTAECLLSGVR